MKRLPFAEAREFVRSLNLSGYSEWNAYCRSGKKPANIPANPNKSYKDHGWISMQDFLGHQREAYSLRDYLPFFYAREYVRKLGIGSHDEWLQYCKSGKKPNNIPYHPQVEYKHEGWVSFYDWFGKDEPQYLSFEDARDFARSLNLKSSTEWNEYCKNGKPSRIPANPRQIYLNSGWISFYDWLGTTEPNKEFLPYDEAEKLVRLLGIQNQREWTAYCTSGKKPDNLPSAPRVYYKNKGWVSFNKWVGKEVDILKKKVAV